MENKTGKKQHKTAIAVILALLVTGAAGGVIYGVGEIGGGADVSYEAKKDRTATIGTADNPFTILEVVPTRGMATIGYLIPGQEPIGEAGMAMLSIDSSEKDGSAIDRYYSLFGGGDGASVVDIKNVKAFQGDKSEYQELSDNYVFDCDEIGTDNEQGRGYGEYGYYVYVGRTGGDFTFSTKNGPMRFTYVDDNTGQYDWICVGQYLWNESGDYFKALTPSGYTDENIENGNRAFVTAESENDGTRYRFKPTNELLPNSATSVIDDTSLWLKNNADHDFLITTTGTDGKKQTDVSRYYSDLTSFRAANSERFYTDRYEQKWVSFNQNAIASKDALIQTMFPGQSTPGGFQSRVVSLRPDDLDALKSVHSPSNAEISDESDFMLLLRDVDMVIFHQMSDAGGNDAVGLYNALLADADAEDGDGSDGRAIRNVFSTVNGGVDISESTMQEFLIREAGGNPAVMIFDEEAVSDTNTNLYTLYGMLSNYGAKVAYNLYYSDPSQEDDPLSHPKPFHNFPAKGKLKVSESENGRVGASNFVYGFDGDLNSFTVNFLSPTIGKDDNTKPAFSSHVLPDFSELSELSASLLGMQISYDEDDRGNNFVNAMSMNVMLAALYNNVATDGDYRTSLRVLEVEPTDSFVYKRSNTKWVERFLPYFPWFIGTTYSIGDGTEGSDVVVDTMTTQQLIGSIKDLNEEYDLIIFGGKQDFRNGANGYNDENLNYYDEDENRTSLVYTAVGDYVTTALYRVSMWDQTYDVGSGRYVPGAENNPEQNTGNGWVNWPAPSGSNGNGGKAASRRGSDAYQVSSRYTSNDLTRKMEVALEDFASSNAIIFDTKNSPLFLYDEESGAASVNRYLIDERSEVYELARKSRTINSDSALAVYADTTVLSDPYQIKETTGVKSVVFGKAEDRKKQGENGLPVEYASDELAVKDETITVGGKPYLITGVLQEQPANDQKNEYRDDVLRYTFTLDGERGVKYGVLLSLDQNGNGIFEGAISYQNELTAFGNTLDYTSEDVPNSDLEIYNVTNPNNRKKVTNGELKKGETYEVTRVLPDNLAGAIPWRLEVYKADGQTTRSSRAALNGITRVKRQPDTVKVLCMNPSHNMWSDPGPTVKFYDTSQLVGAKFKRYLEAATDFDVKLDYLANIEGNKENSISVCDVLEKPAGKSFRSFDTDEKWTEFLMQYDMLVLGFKDSAQYTSNERFRKGVKAFIQRGKSVIISHDMVTDVEADGLGAYLGGEHFNMMTSLTELREMTGQMQKTYIPGTNDYSFNSVYLNNQTLPGDEEPIRSTVSVLPIDKARDRTTLRNGAVSDEYLGENQFRLSNGSVILRQGSMKGSKEGTSQSQDDIQWVEDENSTDTSENGNYYPWVNMYRVSDGQFVHSEQYSRNVLNTSSKFANTQDTGNTTFVYDDNVYKNISNKSAYESVSTVTSNIYRLLLFNRRMPVTRANVFGVTPGPTQTQLDDRGGKIPTWAYTFFCTKQVQIANKGQMTSYPYVLGDTITVSDTHAQNFALDLEYDATDSDGDKSYDGDVTVWYNLAGGPSMDLSDGSSKGMYDIFAGDSRNNFYIYTKGNITYTGLGHNGDMTDDEIKLFVNCMISSYRAPMSAAYAKVTNSDVTRKGSEYTVYMEDEGDYDGSQVAYPINLQIVDTSMGNYSASYTLTVREGSKDKVEKGEGEIVKDPDGTPLQNLPVTKDGNYRFDASYEKVSKSSNGEYYYGLTVDSQYTLPTNEVVKMSKTMTLRVVFMPFFELY